MRGMDGMFELPEDHPGFHDEEYRARRAAIAEVGEQWERGQPIPIVEYTEEEHEVWAVVSQELEVRHQTYACAAYLDGAASIDLPSDRLPQLRDVDAAVHARSGFHIYPVPGLVPKRRFYGDLADRVFNSTQYIRHHSVPFYTPEPDIVHEIIGHAQMLASPVFADLHQRAGEASRRSRSEETLDFFSRVFWFTLEFGVVHEDGETKAYGAGLLSSYGEITEFRDADIRPWDIYEMGTRDYDITHYQPVLYEAPSFKYMVDELSAFFSTFDDAAHARLINDHLHKESA
jgi:phenylalanine-4-hydroxylase